MALFEKSDQVDGSFYVPGEKLKIGLYVFIDLPWFSHPFALNSFRISNQEQIQLLRSLGIQQFRCDPLRSDIDPDEPLCPSLPVDTQTADFKTGQSECKSEYADNQERNSALIEYRIRMERVEKAFLKSTKLMRELNRDLVSKPGETLREVVSLVDEMVVAFLNSTEITLHVMSEKFSATEPHSHGLNVTVLSMMLSRSMQMNAEQARDLCLGALMHDIGKIEVPDRVLRKRPEEQTKPERDLCALHCEFGARIGTNLGLSSEILGIILQHHEMADGTGYPRGLKLESISLPSRIVALANHYDNLCNPVDPAQAMTPHEALSFMFGQRRAKFDVSILQQMIRSLGVYPPGSIVSLSNGATGLVISVNPSRPLRPVVMIYDAAVAKDDAILLDLAAEGEIAIVKANNPKLLPPAVSAYLSPRRRVSYYFDGGAQADRVSA